MLGMLGKLIVLEHQLKVPPPRFFSVVSHCHKDNADKVLGVVDHETLFPKDAEKADKSVVAKLFRDKIRKKAPVKWRGTDAYISRCSLPIEVDPDMTEEEWVCYLDENPSLKKELVPYDISLQGVVTQDGKPFDVHLWGTLDKATTVALRRLREAGLSVLVTIHPDSPKKFSAKKHGLDEDSGELAFLYHSSAYRPVAAHVIIAAPIESTGHPPFDPFGMKEVSDEVKLVVYLKKSGFAPPAGGGVDTHQAEGDTPLAAAEALLAQL